MDKNLVNYIILVIILVGAYTGVHHFAIQRRWTIVNRKRWRRAARTITKEGREGEKRTAKKTTGKKWKREERREK